MLNWFLKCECILMQLLLKEKEIRTCTRLYTGLALCIVILVTLDTGPALCIDTSLGLCRFCLIFHLLLRRWSGVFNLLKFDLTPKKKKKKKTIFTRHRHTVCLQKFWKQSHWLHNTSWTDSLLITCSRLEFSGYMYWSDSQTGDVIRDAKRSSNFSTSNYVFEFEFGIVTFDVRFHLSLT